MTRKPNAAEPIQLTIDEFIARIAARQTPAETIAARPSVRRYQLQLSAELSLAEYQTFGTVELDLDLSAFLPDAAFLLRHFPALAYYLDHPDLLPADRPLDLWVGRRGVRLPDAHFTIPASALYAAR